MAKNNKIKLGFKRRISLYYSRFFLLVKLKALLIVALLLFTNTLEAPKQKILNSLATAAGSFGLVLDNVIVEGQKNVTLDEIISAIGTEAGAPIYLVNIEDIRKKIEENPWVKIALVERRLPNNLYIAIIERAPIAIWQFNNKLYLIDEDGNRITSKNIEKFPGLVHVVGQDANIYAKALIEDLDKHPTLAKKTISAVRYGQRRWDLNLDQKINVKMPEKGFEEAYDYLNSLNKKDKLFNQNYKIINLQDPNKYYIEKHDEPTKE